MGIEEVSETIGSSIIVLQRFQIKPKIFEIWEQDQAFVVRRTIRRLWVMNLRVVGYESTCWVEYEL